MKNSRFKLCLLLSVSIGCVDGAGGATSLTGSTGLLFVPSAAVTRNERFAFGGVVTDYQAFPAKDFEEFRKDLPTFYFGGYLTVGFIPRLEVTIRGNGMPGTVGPGGADAEVGPYYTDGMMSMQVLLVRGSGLVPSVGAGLQDMYGFMLFNAMYAVATWRSPDSGSGAVEVTVGWAVSWYDTHRGTGDEDFEVNHVLDGFMAGVFYPVTHRTGVVVEYDSRSLNAGVRLRLAPWCTLDLAAPRWGLDQLARRRIRGFAAHLHFDGEL